MRSINADRLLQAREAAGLNQSKLAALVGVSQPTLSRVQRGEMLVSDELLASFCQHLDVRPDYLLHQDSDLCATPSFFRRRQSMPRRTLKTLQAQLDMARTALAGLFGPIGHTLPRLEVGPGNDAVSIARQLRVALKVPSGPIEDLVALVERAGILIVPFAPAQLQFDAVCFPSCPRTPAVIFIRMDAPCDRLRFSIAHELGHLIMHRFPSETQEDEANAFAGEFLVPANEIRGHLAEATLPDLARLKERWRVSMAMLLYRAKVTGAMSAGQLRYRWIQMSRAGFRKNEPVQIEPERPTLWRERFEALGLSDEDIESCTGLPLLRVRELLSLD